GNRQAEGGGQEHRDVRQRRSHADPDRTRPDRRVPDLGPPNRDRRGGTPVHPPGAGHPTPACREQNPPHPRGAAGLHAPPRDARIRRSSKRTDPAAGGSTGQRTKTELSGSRNPAPRNKEITMGKPGDPTARVMMTPVPAHLTTDNDQLTDAAVIGVGRYGAKA